MSDSALVTRYIPAYAGNYTKGRAAYGTIEKITVHHCASVLTIDDLGRLWQRPGREGSSHYGVSGKEVGQYVPENDIAWTDGDWPSNCRSITIETSNCAGAPDWPVDDETLDTLVRLVADIAKRRGLGLLVPGETLTWHSMYAATACPGPYLLARMQEIADRANAINTDAPDPRLTLEPVEGKEMRTLTGSCEIFQELSVDKPVGKLPADTVYEVLAIAQEATELAGLSGPWVQLRTAAGEEYYCLALTDRAEIADAAAEAPAEPVAPPEPPAEETPAEETPAPTPDKPTEHENGPSAVTPEPVGWLARFFRWILSLFGGERR